MSIYDYSYTANDGQTVSMKTYEGKVIVIANTASKCGFTPQYEGLEALYEQYRDQGLVVIGFPSNQFMEQEPGDDEQIADFCMLNYGVTFPLSTKVDVRGEQAIELFRYLTACKGFEGFGKGLKSKAMETMLRAMYGRSFSDEQIKWNFTKFLIDREGNVIKRYEPMVEPSAMAADIEALL